MTITARDSPHRRPRLSQVALTDWLLGGVGFTMATASAGFAGYMIATAPAEVTGSGSKDFNIFVQWDKRTPQAASHGERAPPTPALAAATAPAPEKVATAAVDPMPTGSVPDEANITREPRDGSKGGSPRPLREFRLRDVFGGRALIEHRSRLSLVQPGSILAGAGEVLAIERQGDGWIVRTASGVIGGS